jgi:hypothetical protein
MTTTTTTTCLSSEQPRWARCRKTRKAIHADAAEADAVRRKLYIENEADPGLEVYPCRHCKGFHLGNPHKFRSLERCIRAAQGRTA